MEYWDIYDKDKKRTGKIHLRGDDFYPGEYHLISHVWIKRSNGDLLLTKRHKNKLSYPLLWDCISGCVQLNECSIDCAVREAREEIGVLIDKEAAKFVYTYFLPDTYRYYDVFLFDLDIDIENLVLQTDEVTAVKWASYDEIVHLSKNGMLVPTLSYFNMLFKNHISKDDK